LLKEEFEAKRKKKIDRAQKQKGKRFFKETSKESKKAKREKMR
jgi:hypothetical protein